MEAQFQEDLMSHARALDPAIHFAPSAAVTKQSPANIFITGATGFLGKLLLTCY